MNNEFPQTHPADGMLDAMLAMQGTTGAEAQQQFVKEDAAQLQRSIGAALDFAGYRLPHPSLRTGDEVGDRLRASMVGWIDL